MAKLASTTVVLAAIALIGIIVMICMGKTVPQDFWGLTLAIITGHFALSAPSAVTPTVPAPVVTQQVTPQPGTVPTGSAG